MNYLTIKSKWTRGVLCTAAGVIVGLALVESNKKQEVPTWIYAMAAVVLSPVAYSKGLEWNQNYFFPSKDHSNGESIHTVSERMVIAEENNT